MKIMKEIMLLSFHSFHLRFIRENPFNPCHPRAIIFRSQNYPPIFVYSNQFKESPEPTIK